MASKVCSATEAIKLINDNDTIAISGVGLTGYPEGIIRTLEDCFLSENKPGNLTVIGSSGQGDRKGTGADHLAHMGLVNKAYFGHYRASPKFCKMALDGEFEAYCLPQGIIVQLYRACGAGHPGVLSKVGLGTYIDPRLKGGKVNSRCKEDAVKLFLIEGEEYLFYPVIPVDVAVIRGTTADEEGNVTIEREALRLEIAEMALAARASGGKVIVQVEEVVARGSLPPKSVVVPSILVDAVVLGARKDRSHWQTSWEPYSPSFSGEENSLAGREPLPLDIVKVIARRGCRELRPGFIVNVGLGISGAVARVASEEGCPKDVVFSIEMGAIGGQPAGYPHFPAMYNPVSFLSHVQMFDYYHSFGVDIAFLGAAEIDEKGCVNVSRFGSSAGQGGFIDICEKAREIIFCTSFTGGASELVVENGLCIKSDGPFTKFVKEVREVTFDTAMAAKRNKKIKLITERAVFAWFDGVWMLQEVAPGIDIKSHIIDRMDFTPIVPENVKIMDINLFI